MGAGHTPVLIPLNVLAVQYAARVPHYLMWPAASKPNLALAVFEPIKIIALLDEHSGPVPYLICAMAHAELIILCRTPGPAVGPVQIMLATWLAAQPVAILYDLTVYVPFDYVAIQRTIARIWLNMREPAGVMPAPKHAPSRLVIIIMSFIEPHPTPDLPCEHVLCAHYEHLFYVPNIPYVVYMPAMIHLSDARRPAVFIEPDL